MGSNITIIIAILTILISAQGFSSPTLFNKFKHWPYDEKRNHTYYRLFTSGFLHGDWGHLLVNMFVLWSFGGYIENIFKMNLGEIYGSVMYVVFYLVAIVAANIVPFIRNKDNYAYSAIGASGAISALLFSYILFDPMGTILLYAVIPIKAFIWGGIYLLYESWASRNANDNIGHDAHFYGAVFGILFSAILFPDAIRLFLGNFGISI